MKFGVFAFQAVPDAPSVGTSQPAPAPGAAEAPAPAPDGFGSFLPMLILVPLLGIMFWQGRSQQKKQEAAVAGLKKGDRVLTQSGLVGRVASLGERYVELEMVPSTTTKFTVLRTAIAGRDTEGDPAKSAKAAAKKK